MQNVLSWGRLCAKLSYLMRIYIDYMVTLTRGPLHIVGSKVTQIPYDPLIAYINP